MLCNDRSCNMDVVYCDAGSELKPEYHGKINKKGQIELELIGMQNIQDKIEAERPGTELSVLIARYENGDLLALNSNPGFYADLTKFPGSVIDAMNLVRDAQLEFEKLPADIKTKFGSDWRVWLAQSDSKDWVEVMKKYYQPDVQVNEKESEVKNDAE